MCFWKERRCFSLPQPSAAHPLYSFLRKRSSHREHMPNRRLAASASAKKSVTRAKIAGSACQWRPRTATDIMHLPNGVTEITKSSPRPGHLLPLDTLSKCTRVHSSTHCCAIWTLRRCDLRSGEQILRLIQSAAFRLSDSANILVVSQFCMRLTVVLTSRLGEA